MNEKRTTSLSEYLAKFRRGEISKKQFLNQKKFLLQEELKEQAARQQAAAFAVTSISSQIKEVEIELQKAADQAEGGA